MFNTRSSNNNIASEFQFLLSYIVGLSFIGLFSLQRRNGREKCSRGHYGKKEMKWNNIIDVLLPIRATRDAQDRGWFWIILIVRVYVRKTRFDCWYNSIIIPMYQLQMKIKATLSAEKNYFFLSVSRLEPWYWNPRVVFFLSFLHSFALAA